MAQVPASNRAIVVKTMVTHTVTYFVAGVAAFLVFAYPTLISETAAGAAMRPLRHPMVIAGPLLQPVRGLLFGVVFSLLREPFFVRRDGWLLMWIVLVAFGILGTFGAPPGSLEGFIYTTVPFSVQVTFLPEVLLQSLALSWLVFHWVNSREKKWLDWTFGAAFVIVLLLPALQLMTALRR